MVFKKLLGAFGVGGPAVDTVLANPNTRPGLILDGQVHIRGGDHDVTIDQVSLALVTRVEVESGDGEFDATQEFHRVAVSGGFGLAAGERKTIGFQFPVPWEAPVTDVYGQRLHGMTMGLRTELAVARAVDKGDLDPVSIHPLPAQETVLAAMARLGFQFNKADLEHGRIRGVAQTLPFYQEIEYFAAPQYAHALNELELTFVANPHAVDVILEVDKRGGLFTGGRDVFHRFQVPHAGVEQADWAAQIDAWLQTAVLPYAGGRGGFAPAHGHDHGHHGGGFGAGALVAGVGAGLVGGYLAGEVMDEVFDDGGGGEE